MDTKEFESLRAKTNLKQTIKYRKVLEWVKNALEQNIYSRESIIYEIKKALTEDKSHD